MGDYVPCPDAEVCQRCPQAAEDDACFPCERMSAELAEERAAREKAEAERDNWQAMAVAERGLVAGDAYKRVLAHITDELDKQAGAGSALSVATALATASEARAEKAEARLRELESDEAVERLAQLLMRQRFPGSAWEIAGDVVRGDLRNAAREYRDALLEGDQSAELRSRGRT